jgi:hypothetical protein
MMNAESTLKQAQMANLLSALGLGTQAATANNSGGTPSWLNDIVGGGLDWLFGDEGVVYDADVGNTEEYYDDNGVYDDFGNGGGPQYV